MNGRQNDAKLKTFDQSKKLETYEKSKMYEIICTNCNAKYVRHKRRPILTRFKQHMADLRYGRKEKSNVVKYAIKIII